MEKENASGEAEQSSGEQGQEETVESLKARIAAMEKKNAEILGEKKSVSEKLSKFEQEKAENEKRLLAEQGKYKDLFEKSEREKLELANKTKSKVMDEQIKRAAAEAKCVHVSALMKLAGGYEKEVDFDSDLNANPKTLTAYIEKMKTDYPFLFTSQAPAIKDGNPADGAAEVDFSKLSQKEKEELKRKLLAGG